jgi:magnesium-transporting ATPase (P-type)
LRHALANLGDFSVAMLQLILGYTIAVLVYIFLVHTFVAENRQSETVEPSLESMLFNSFMLVLLISLLFIWLLCLLWKNMIGIQNKARASSITRIALMVAGIGLPLAFVLVLSVMKRSKFYTKALATECLQSEVVQEEPYLEQHKYFFAMCMLATGIGAVFFYQLIPLI